MLSNVTKSVKTDEITNTDSVSAKLGDLGKSTDGMDKKMEQYVEDVKSTETVEQATDEESRVSVIGFGTDAYSQLRKLIEDVLSERGVISGSYPTVTGNSGSSISDAVSDKGNKVVNLIQSINDSMWIISNFTNVNGEGKTFWEYAKQLQDFTEDISSKVGDISEDVDNISSKYMIS